MSGVEQLLERYATGVRFPKASGFEVLELLDVRSRLATREAEMDAAQRQRLEDADAAFLGQAPTLYESVAALGDLGDMRQRAAVPPSHWWWYLEKLGQREVVR